MAIGQKKSTKSRSKRVKLKDKHKAIKKVAEHKKKLNKAQKKKAAVASKKPKKLMAPSVPSDWPFKEQVMQEYEAMKRKEVEEDEAKKQARKDRKAENKRLASETNQSTAELLQQQAAKRALEFEQRSKERAAKKKAHDPSDPDGSRRAFYREFVRVVEQSDVVLHVLDARDPLGCRCPDVERYIVKKNPNKKIVLLLNKIDLVPQEVVKQWLKYLRGELPTVAFKCSTQKGAVTSSKSKVEASKAIDGYSGAECLGSDTLLQLLKNYSRNAGLKTAITVGIVGFPNVGKSSIINSLMRQRAVGVGHMPGMTRQAQEIHLDKNVKLLDSPGIVFPTDTGSNTPVAAALRNAVRLEKLDDPIAPVGEIVSRCKPAQLMQIYQIPRFTDTTDFLKHVALARGKLKKGGLVDLTQAARQVLQDWSTGKIPYFTTPPERTGAEYAQSSIVNAWAHDFDAEKVFALEESAVIAGLPTMGDSMFIETMSAGQVNGDIAGIEAAGGDADAMDDSDDDEAPALAPAQKHRVGGSNVDLYAAAGQLDPRAAKKAKKAAKKGGLPMEDEEAEDGYDFGTDFQPSAAQMDDDDDDDGDGDEEDEDEEDDEDEDGMED